MAQMSLEELYRGEGAGEKYGILGEVMKDFFENGHLNIPPKLNTLTVLN